MHAALADLRRTRRERRLGDLEWFDVAYRVYLAGLFGGGAVIVLSDMVGDAELSASGVADALGRGPSLVGIVACVAVAVGLRSGSEGGPLSVETADVTHLLAAPVPRRQVLMRPYVQRLRTMVFLGAVVGAIAGQLAAQRLPGSAAAWAGSGALAGGVCGALFVGTATLAHAWRLPGWSAGVLGTVLVAAQALAAATSSTGPGDPVGHLALWGGTPDATGDASAAGVAGAIVVAAVVAAAGAVTVGGLRVEPLVRRGALVSQLRFAVTMQDLRTVVLLRRQLGDERPRSRPWWGPRPGTAARTPGRPLGPVRVAWQRGWRGLARTPLDRLGRMALLAAGGGLAASAVLDGTTPAIVPLGVLAFVLGLDVLEPLSQEIDHPDRTDALAVERGRLHLGLVLAPLVMLVPFALVGAAAVIVVEPGRWPVALVLAVPVTWLGAAGAAVNVVRDATPRRRREGPALAPPEFAGFGTAVRTLFPVLVSMTAALPVLAVRSLPSADAVMRSLLGAALVLAAVGQWIRRRDRWRSRWDSLLAGARP